MPNNLKFTIDNNKMRFFGIFIFICLFQVVDAQKKQIDTAVFGKWGTVVGGQISRNGAYISYVICNHPVGSETLTVQSAHSSWKKSFLCVNGAQFTQDGQFAVLALSNTGDLKIVKLGSDRCDTIFNVSSCELINSGKGAGWLAISLKNKQLLVKKLGSSDQKVYDSVESYWICKSKDEVLLYSKGKKGQLLRLISPATGKIGEIRQDHIENLVFNTDGSAIAFTTTEIRKDQNFHELWLYKFGAKQPTALLSDSSHKFANGLHINDVVKFSEDGNHIFFKLKEKVPQSRGKATGPAVDLWSYLDPEIKPVEQAESKRQGVPEYTAVVNLSDQKVVQLTHSPKEEVTLSAATEKQGYELMTERGTGGYDDESWSKLSWSQLYKVSINNGEKKEIMPQCLTLRDIFSSVSPDGRYIIWYDPKLKSYFSYDSTNEKVLNITDKLTANWNFEVDGFLNDKSIPMGSAGWLPEKEAIILRDQHDLWQIDVSGRSKPINLTAGMGKDSSIVFALAQSAPDNTFKSHEPITLYGFNQNTKEPRFYQATISESYKPVCLTPAGTFDHKLIEGDQGSAFVKAKDASYYLLCVMSAANMPNYFLSTDLKHFQEVSNYHPEKGYNWMHAELINWVLPGGGKSQGVLYKPDNFDPSKKYPMIFYLYEKFSDELGRFYYSDFGGGRICIPYYVSQGYLVFCPDIHYKIGDPGGSTYNSIVSAAHHLFHYPYIDSTRVGIQGHSMGGYEVNYLVSHTNMFAAAVSGSGISDLIPEYNSVRAGARNKQWDYEEGQLRMGYTMWAHPDWYIKNSPVFSADKVNTPLLMMSNHGDQVVSFFQGLEFFDGLRRLGKRVWMLQYDHGGHTVGDDDVVDLTIRTKQFFDHYLMGKPAPIWMTRGIPAADKGYKNGYEYDTEIKTPGPGLPRPDAQQEIDKHAKIPLSKKLQQMTDDQ